MLDERYMYKVDILGVYGTTFEYMVREEMQRKKLYELAGRRN